MFSEILALLSEGKTLSQYDLAERLDTTPEIIVSRLDFLQRAGYLRKICAVKDCGKKCTGCIGGSVAAQNFPSVWEATK
ncbi:MAG: FeoC-like transcriptional regulator [Acidaminococcales bacterium]|jgi:DNA-binding Lrp family transcriptional regulator|nr:FeoC-like transcriptional regulator [Acidaminococcales bacterium]